MKKRNNSVMPTRREVYDAFTKGKWPEIEGKGYAAITRQNCEQIAIKILAKFDIPEDGRGFPPEDDPYYDIYGPSIKLKETLTNLICLWLGGSEEDIINDEGIEDDWTW